MIFINIREKFFTTISMTETGSKPADINSFKAILKIYL